MAKNSYPNTAVTLEKIIQRADELAEFLSLYWKGGKCPISKQVKKGLAKAFTKFNEYSLAKYNRQSEIKLKDVMFMVHPKPVNQEQEDLWQKLIDEKLKTPDTWEVELSKSKNKKESWTRLLKENKLGSLALIRNLRNMNEANVDEKLIFSSLEKMNVDRVLPFRFVSAAQHAPQWEDKIEKSMFKALENKDKLKGKTILIIDVSGSMRACLSGKSMLNRMDAANALAILAREISKDIRIYATAGNDHMIKHKTEIVPNRRGFALRDAIQGKYNSLGGGGIFLTQVMDYVYDKEKNADRIIVFTDEQDTDTKLSPAKANSFGNKNYLVNIASHKHGIGYGKWHHIDGFSEAVLDYIIAFENLEKIITQ